MAETNKPWIEGVLSIAKRQIRAGNRAGPVFLMKSGNLINVTDLNTLPDKDTWSMFMRTIISVAKPDEYAFIGESWMRKFDVTKEEEKRESEIVTKGLKHVHELNNVDECIMVVHGGRAEKERMGIIQFKRLENDVEFSDIEWLPKSIQGRFANLGKPFGGDFKVN